MNDSTILPAARRPAGVDGKPAKWFLYSAAALLFLTGASKVYSAFGDGKILDAEDPIVGVTYAQLILWLGVAELIVAALSLYSKTQRVSLRLIAGMATSFLGYRVLLWYTHSPRPCACMGHLADPLGLSPETADTIMKVVLAYLLVGSYVTVGWLGKQTQQVSPPAA